MRVFQKSASNPYRHSAAGKESLFFLFKLKNQKKRSFGLGVLRITKKMKVEAIYELPLQRLEIKHRRYFIVVRKIS